MLSRILFSSVMLSLASLAASSSWIPTIQDVQNWQFSLCENVTVSGTTYLVPTYWTDNGANAPNNQPTVRCQTYNPNATFTTNGNNPEWVYSPPNSAYFVPQTLQNNVDVNNLNPLYEAAISQDLWVLERGQQLTLSYWLKAGVAAPYSASRGDWNFSVWWGHDGEEPVRLAGQLVEILSLENAWEKYEVTFNAPQDHGHVNPKLTLKFSTIDPNTRLYLDDVQLSSAMILGDPQFVGIRGQSYQVHGIDGGIYNLVTSPSTQINAKFVFLSSGNCPIFDGIADSNCWAHPGSYLGAIGVQEIVNGQLHKVVLVAGPSTEGFTSVIVDGEELELNQTVEDTSDFLVSRSTSHRVVVSTSQFTFFFDNSDMFINQAIKTRVSRLAMRDTHGLFGQTHRLQTYPTPLRVIEGDVDDYLISEDNLFGQSFPFNKFQVQSS